MKTYMLILLILSGSLKLAAQEPFHKYLSVEEKSGTLYRTVKTSDGGYAAYGQISSFSSFPVSDLLLIKTDQNGNASWIRQINNSFYDNNFPGIANAENGLVITGTMLNGSDYNAFVQKLDYSGNPVWTKLFSSNEGISVTGRKIIRDGGDIFYVLGTIGWSTLFILELDPDGNILRQNTVEVWNGEIPTTFLRSNNQDFFITCQSGGFGNTHMIKLNSEMELVWRKMLIGGNYIYCSDLHEKNKGNLVMTGSSYYYGEPTISKSFLAEIDAGTGNVLWSKSYSSPYGTNNWAYGLAIDADDQLIVTGRGNASGLLLFGTNDLGYLAWSATFGTTENELSPGYGVLDDGNGSFVVCGKRWAKDNSVVHLMRFSPTGEDICFLTDAPSMNEEQVNISTQVPEIPATDGYSLKEQTPGSEISDIVSYPWKDVCTVTGIDGLQDKPALSVHPNPSDGNIMISTGSAGPVKSVKVINTLGYEVFSLTSPEQFTDGEIPVNISVSGGIYFILVNTEDKQFSSRIVVR